MIPVVITTHKSRQQYIQDTYRSLANAGFANIDISYGDIDPRTDWATAALKTIRHNPGKSHILIVQDDILVAKGLCEYADRIADKWLKNTGCVSLYTPDKYLETAKIPGFPAENMVTWGACALLFPTHILKQVITDDLFLHFHGNRDIDRAIGTTMAHKGLHFWYVFPSVVQHVGQVSTLCDAPAKGWRQASTFPGENVSCAAQTLPWE